MGAVEDVLLSLVGSQQPIVYVPNGGNAGDSLINVGFYQLARRHGIEHTMLKRRDSHLVTSDHVVVIGGGGALIPEWTATPRFVADVAQRAARIVILPHSARDVDDVLAMLRPQDTLILREKYSYEYCQSLGLACEVSLDDDIALSVSVPEAMAAFTDFRPQLTRKNAGRYAAVGFHKARSRLRHSVNAFRCDREADQTLDVPRHLVNDLSTVGWFSGAGDEPGSTYSARQLLRLIDFYDEIHTDRLHVVIGSALLGKKVVAYANNYYKVRGVIEQSLGDYPHLELRSPEPAVRG